MCRLSWNLGASNSWNPQGLSRPVMGLLYLIRRWVKNYAHCGYMFCSWLYCWLGMTRYTWSNPFLPLWCRCDLDSPFLSWVFCHKHGHPNFICTKEERRAVIHFCGLKVYQVSKCIEWCQCSMGTVSCYNGRTSVKHGEGTGRQSTSITDADTAHTVETKLWGIGASSV
jgi:hypothetical protein